MTDKKIHIADGTIDYRKILFEKYDNNIEYIDIVDDEYIDDHDKKNLIKYCKEIIDLEMGSYPSPMYEILIERRYKDIIRNMDKAQYLEEKEQMKKKTVFELELEKISNMNLNDL